MQSIILARRDFRENDQLISLYTAEKGKVEALAKGVKKIISKNSAYLEPFCFVEAEVIPGRDWARLGSVNPINLFKNIRADLVRSLAAEYAVDLADKVIHVGEPDQRVFALLQSWLEWVDGDLSFPRKRESSRRPVGVWTPAFAGVTGVGLSGVALLNAFIAKFLTLLGFDPSADEANKGIRKELEYLAHGSWELIGTLKYESGTARRVQSELYGFALKHLERKIGDWARLEKIGCFL